MEPFDLRTLEENVFSLFDQQWTLITAGPPDRCNPMTASWGGLGVLWHKDVATIYVRPQRYTYEFLEREDYFTLSFFDEDRHKDLQYFGSASGRDEDKFAARGYHVQSAAQGQAAYPQEARLVLVCRKLYWNDLDPAHIPPEDMKHYKENDFHRMYIGEIVQALRR